MAKLNILEHSNIESYYRGLNSKVRVEAILEKEDIRPDYIYVVTVFVNGVSDDKVCYCNFVKSKKCDFRTDKTSIQKLIRLQCICDLEFNIPKDLNISSVQINLSGFTLDEYDPSIPDILSWRNYTSEKIKLKEKEGN